MPPATEITPKHLLHHGTPEQIREAILPEDRERFDASLRRALSTAGETLSLAPVEQCLAHWRRLAASQTMSGHDGWREMLAKADRILAGERFPTVSAEEHRRRLDDRLATGR